MASPPKLLVLDEDRLQAPVIQRAAAPAWEVSFFIDPEEALRAVLGARFDAVLTELSVKGATAAEFLSNVRRVDPRVLCGVLTASKDFALLAKAVNAGILGRLISKPAQPSDFQTLLQMVRPSESHPVEAAASTSTSAQPGGGRRAQKILIVDDSETVMDFAQEVLKDAGYQTVALDNPFQILTRIEKEKPDLVLLDVKMPALDGPRLIESMSRFPFLPKKRILFHSSLSAVELSSLVAEFGVGGFIRKGSEEELLKAVQFHLSR